MRYFGFDFQPVQVAFLLSRRREDESGRERDREHRRREERGGTRDRREERDHRDGRSRSSGDNSDLRHRLNRDR